MNKENIMKLASEKLNNPDLNVVEQSSKEIEGIGYYFAEPIRGGKQFIIGYDGGYLFGLSYIDLDTMIDAYQQGKRTE